MEVAAGKRVAHGGDLSAIRRRFPDAMEPWIDLSTGINPVPYPVGDLSPEIWQRLPTRRQEEALLGAAARRYGARDIGTIVAAPGTQALIQILPRLVPKSRVAVIGPTYEEHEVCWRRHGHDVSVRAYLDQVGDADIVIAVNPDNPTGRVLPADRMPTDKRLLVVDEAFVDVLPEGASMASRLPPRTILLRSFGKTYGLAGLRLGFAVANADLAEALRDQLGPWAVSGPALEIGRVALDDDAWLAAATERLICDRRHLDEILVRAGFAVVGGTPLFCLVEHPEALSLADKLARHGIHVRRFDAMPTRLRFGLPGNSQQFERLAGALAG